MPGEPIAPSVAQLARALEGPFIGDKLAVPGTASDRVLIDAMPVFSLTCFGGPFELTEDRRPELAGRLETIRERLNELVARLEHVSDPELKKWLYGHGKSSKVWKGEGKRLKLAACVLFQLERKRPSEGKEELRRKLNKLWKQEGETSAWFKRNREQFICEKLAIWLTEDEERQLASEAANRVAGSVEGPSISREEPATPSEDGLQTEDGSRDSTEAAKRRQSVGRKAMEYAHTTKGLRASRLPRSSDMIASGAAILAILAIPAIALLASDSGRILGEPSIQTSTSPAAALGCVTGQVDDFEVLPDRLPASDPRLIDPSTLSVRVGQVRFWFESLTHRDRPAGYDSWDFVFKPRRVAGDLEFIFRSDIASGGGYGYVIDGPPGGGQEPTNGVCALEDFHKTNMGEFLKDRSNSDGFEWAAQSPQRDLSS